ncbi:uncharacterized protein NECHADRAFT_45399 [Fusarium vanettenii 77-13-4]|uniref:Uncharacterized protein n=1 Tax=Fusarium vanettenii (strain ATCC MYA-4622 / CBS 123669 / FGSC 9596 / NRRL 45880 / 77-13-4) TaxID=660122 RepID=C7YWW2_FUSV7|nr:uncharacterized protein NECHADRAFT_45399 [Fusarium vanettenii 77-13-4]EEU43724.1 hypothetical protein NECHADRAFT_45399 [Fusarium vanettenii 77-13-4]
MASISTPRALWNITLLQQNATAEEIIALPWVNSPNVRGTMDILQSCILTLVACIYTALHLDVPKRTSSWRLFLTKLKWVAITLFVPELPVFMAADQLHQAWKLRQELRELKKRDESSNVEFEIDLRYCFFMIMGGIRLDVHDIISMPDLDLEAIQYFKDDGGRRSVRPSPETVSWLAKQNIWIEVSQKTIDDKSKADILQKILVVIQKPLNVQEPVIYEGGSLTGEIALKIEHQFYADMKYLFALFPPRTHPDQAPSKGPHRMKMRWVDTPKDSIMRPGDVLPSGLALCCTVPQEHHREDQENAEPDYGEVPVTEQFLHRWDCILKRYAFEDCERLSRERKITLYANDFLRVDPRPLPCMDEDPPTPYLALLDEFTPFRRTTFKNIPFAEGKDNFDIKFLDMLGGRVTLQPADFFRICWQIPELMALAAALSGMYGGVHLTAWNWIFPTYTEDLLWKVSCLCVAVALPAFFCASWVLVCISAILHCLVEPCFGLRKKWASRAFKDPLRAYSACVAIVYVCCRIFIVAEAFVALRQVPVGVYISPAWVQMVPHF